MTARRRGRSGGGSLNSRSNWRRSGYGRGLLDAVDVFYQLRFQQVEAPSFLGGDQQCAGDVGGQRFLERRYLFQCTHGTAIGVWELVDLVERGDARLVGETEVAECIFDRLALA